MKQFYIILAMLFVAVPMQARDTVVHKFTFEDCLDYAFDNSYNRQILKLNEDAKKNLYEQSKYERLPNLNASLSEGFSNSDAKSFSWSGSYDLSTSVTLYQGGSINKTIEQSRLIKEQTVHQTNQSDNQLIIQILQAFLTVLGNEELLKYQEILVEASGQQLKQGQQQYEVGTILESDYLLLEAQYANDRNNVLDTKINRDNSLLTLKGLLSMSPLEDLRIVYPDTSSLHQMSLFPTLGFVLEKVAETLPDLKVAQYNIDIAKKNVDISKSSYMPTLSLSASVGTGHVNSYSNFGDQFSKQFNEQVGLKLNVPIFNNSRTKSRVTQSRIVLRQAELEQKQTELNVLQTITQEYQDVVSSYNKYEVTNIRQAAYHKTFLAYNVQFNAGTITAVDLLQQQNNYISALNDFIQSKYGFMLKRKVLDVYMGFPVKM
ncbi:MAG: TolC family protein [Prevotellaceae bacterium]|nr:TolC family protein [Prevotellaceae bacterium]